MLSASFIAFCLLNPAQPADSHDWSMFRGPNGSGLAREALPADLSLENNLVWKVSVPKGYSSPVLQDGRIFLTAEHDGQLLTLCLDEETGQELWRATAPRSRTEKLDQRNHAAAASAAVRGDSVVVFFGDFGLLCYSRDGEERWRLPLGPFNNIYGMGASPVIVDDKAILVCDQNTGSFVIAVDLASGDVVWRKPRPAATSGHCTPIVFRPGPNKPAQVLVAGSFELTAYAVSTGERVWWCGGLSFEMKSTPVFANGLVFVNGYATPHNQPDNKITVETFEQALASGDANSNGVLERDEMPDDLSAALFVAFDLDGNKSLDRSEWRYFENSMASENSIMAITPGGRGDVTRSGLQWKYHKNIPQLPSPVAARGRLYMVNDGGIVTSFMARTGEVRGRGRLAGAPGSVYASPVIAGDHVLFLTTRGSLAFVRIGDDLSVESLIRFREPCFATPAIAGRRLYVRTNDHLFCLGAR